MLRFALVMISPGWADQSHKLSRLDLQIQATQDTYSRPRRIPEVHIAEDNMSLCILQRCTFQTFCIDFDLRIEKLDDGSRCTFCARYIRNECEDVTSLNRSEDYRSERHEELPGADFAIGKKI